MKYYKQKRSSIQIKGLEFAQNDCIIFSSGGHLAVLYGM